MQVYGGVKVRTENQLIAKVQELLSRQATGSRAVPVPNVRRIALHAEFIKVLAFND